MCLADVEELSFMATDSDEPVRDLPLFSIRFATNATSVVVPFGNHHVRIWEPESAIDDTTLKELSGKGTLLGMKKEIQNLSDLGTGELYNLQELEAKGWDKSCRIIPTRWVATDKGGGITRCRIVVKGIAKNQDSARVLGISSPTPSADAQQALLGVAGVLDLVLGGADVTAAFMATPLRKRDVVAEMPLSTSDLQGQLQYLHLFKALNGLRSASQEWVAFLSEIVAELQLESDDLEPCLFTGRLKSGAICPLLSYVDYILIATETERDFETVMSVIGKKVVLEKTGGEKALFVGLPDDYLKTTFESYGLKSGSRTAPDITPMLDQEGKELTPEAYSRFRSALGKLSWYAQTRQDIGAWIGLVATQQAKPTDCTEKALKAVLRYPYEDQRVVLRIPSEIPPRDGMSHPMALTQEDRLVCFSDASHPPLKSTGRRGVTGGVITYRRCLIKTLSRHQQLVSLSSMEAELYALQAVAQEMVAVGKFLGRVMSTMAILLRKPYLVYCIPIVKVVSSFCEIWISLGSPGILKSNLSG
eukprot:s4145_g3.t1